MVKVTQDTRSREDYLKVKIDLPSFQFDIMSSDPRTTLPELRRILEVLHLDEDVAYEAAVQQDLRSTCSQSFLDNAEAMVAVKSLVRQADAYRIATADIPITTAVDLDANSRVGKLSRRDVQRAISRIVTDVDCANVRHGIVHVVGELDREGKVLIADNIHRLMPTAQLRAFYTRAEGGPVLVECVFFGDFPEDDD